VTTAILPAKMYSASPLFFAFAMDEAFVAEIWQKAFDRPGDFAIQTSVGIDDPVIGQFGALGRRELMRRKLLFRRADHNG